MAVSKGESTAAEATAEGIGITPVSNDRLLSTARVEDIIQETLVDDQSILPKVIDKEADGAAGLGLKM